MEPGGSFTLITGDPSPGKSVTLRLLAERLERVRAASLSMLTHGSSSIGDLYREIENLSSAVSAAAELLAAAVSQERDTLDEAF